MNIALISVSSILLFISICFLIRNLFMTRTNVRCVYISTLIVVAFDILTMIASAAGIAGLFISKQWEWVLFPCIFFFGCLIVEMTSFYSRIYVFGDHAEKYSWLRKKKYPYSTFSIELTGLTYRAVDQKSKTIFTFGLGKKNNKLILDTYNNYYEINSLPRFIRDAKIIKRNKIDIGVGLPFFVPGGFLYLGFFTDLTSDHGIRGGSIFAIIFAIISTMIPLWLILSHFFNWFEITDKYIIIHRLFMPARKFKKDSLDMVYFYMAWYRIIKKESKRTILFFSFVLWDDGESLYNAIKGITEISYDKLADLFRNGEDFNFLDVNENIYDIHFSDDTFSVTKTNTKNEKFNYGTYKHGKEFLDLIKIEKSSYIAIKK